jgi:hypothetical protein
MPCANCHQTRAIMLVMQPGKDGLEWSLCARCYGGASPAPARPAMLGYRTASQQQSRRITRPTAQPLPSSRTRRPSTSE